MSSALKIVAGLYLIIGSLHSVAFDWMISPKSCLTATGLLGFYCNTGMGVSHAAITLAWPLYWLQETKPAEAQHLTGAVRTEGITSIKKSCMGEYERKNSDKVPRWFADKYCQCYAEGLLDTLSADELKNADSPRANTAIKEIGTRCYQNLKDEAMRNPGQN
jgi:hypothetical protein